MKRHLAKSLGLIAGPVETLRRRLGSLLLLPAVLCLGVPGLAAAADADPPLEGDLAPWLSAPQMEMQQLFSEQRFPNVVVARDGTVLAT